MNASAAPLRAAVIGAGPMGLAAAHELVRAGAQVTVFERDDRIGGMSAHTDLAGTRIERYYHFVCQPDETTFEWLREFGLESRLKWVDTKMGFYFDGRLYDWGGPLALLRFPGLTFVQKLRFGLHVMKAKSITDWRPYDAFSSTEWLHRWIGKDAYDVMWKRLFHFKFYELQDSLSAAWLGTRIKRVALSRKNIFQERLGYIEGGSEVLLDAVAQRLRGQGVRIELNAPVQSVTVDGRRRRTARRGAAGRRGRTALRPRRLDHPAALPEPPRARPAARREGQDRGDTQRRRGVRAAQAPAPVHAQLLDEHQRPAHRDPGAHRIQQPQPARRHGDPLRAVTTCRRATPSTAARRRRSSTRRWPT